MVQFQSLPTESFQLFLQKARLLDLGPLAHQLMHTRTGYGWSRIKTIRGIARYLAFLYLVDQYARLQLVPTQEIDQVWHQHILDTQKYAEDCHHLFGQIIHHFPYLGTRGEADQHQWYRSYTLTQVLFRKHFGTGFVDASAADCEPLQSLPACRSATVTQSRPTIALSIEEALQFFPLKDQSVF